MTKPYKIKDPYFRRAKELGYRARSVFKLDEIQQRFKLIQPRDVVVDLGACPGSWSERVAQLVGESGQVVAFDLQEIDPIGDNVVIYKADITDHDLMEALLYEPVDGVVADLAPKTTGIADADAYHSAELNHAVLDICERHLKKRGYLITKIFQGEDFQQVFARAKKMFRDVRAFKPKACRDRSRETYIVGMGFRG